MNWWTVYMMVGMALALLTVGWLIPREHPEVAEQLAAMSPGGKAFIAIVLALAFIVAWPLMLMPRQR